MSTQKIIAYLKPSCGWSGGIRAVLGKYNLPYEDRDIINDPNQYVEMVQKSGQRLSPCVEVEGKMLADISGEELEHWMLQNKVVSENNQPVDVPLNQPCAHEMPQPQSVTFKK
ncbi:MAG: glutaredoxin [Verrucomicrobiota bacterium]|nr:glutaredoxin [Verrucomicrobiota bacterium]